MKTSIIYNPTAGSVKDRQTIGEKLQQLSGAQIYLTEKEGDATRFAEDAIQQGQDLVVAAGGDGTLNEVINGIARRADRIQIGLVPLGTGNDFARTLALPDSIEDCIQILRTGKTRAIDLVRVTSDQVRYFVNVSAGGFSGDGERETDARNQEDMGTSRLPAIRRGSSSRAAILSHYSRVG